MNVQEMSPKDIKFFVKREVEKNHREPNSVINEVIGQLQALPGTGELVWFFKQLKNVLGNISASERHKYLTLAFRRHGAIVTLQDYLPWRSRNSSKRSSHSPRNGQARA